MAHRRKSSHPVCKTRRNLEVTVADVSTADDDDECSIIEQGLSRRHGNARDVMETDEEDPQQIVLPSDLFKDFEAVRSQTKLDTTNLMRRLLKDYQSIAGGNEKTLTGSSTEEHVENDVTDSLATKTSIANDVSLATARVDTEDDQYQGLDLSVGPRKINSQLFDTKSLNCESLEQPLDLTCTKPPTTKDSLSNESSSVQQLDMSSVHNEFNYVYVYPGLYPPGTGVMNSDDMEADGQPETSSPVPELLSPGKLPSPDTLERTAYVIPNEVCESNFAAASNRFNEFTNDTRKQQQSTDISHLAKVSPQSIKQEFGEMQFSASGQQSHSGQRGIKQEFGDMQFSSSSQQSRSGQKGGHGVSPNKSGKKESKKSSEMKVISENTSAGVYTSVMKLPWSRRTRTKKPKHKVKLEDTLIPQFMLEQGNEGNDFQGWNTTEPSNNDDSSDQNNSVSKSPECSESVMMVYPSGGTSAYGKPVRKRGRPPKLPMLAKLLQHQQAGKKLKQEKQEEEMQAQITQQVQANGGMVVYNAGGQMTAYGGTPVLQTTSASNEVQNVPAANTFPNMAQAQLIGQIPLSQLTGGPIQFLGQFPAQALPFPGHMLQTIPASSSDPSQLQASTTDTQEQNGDKNATETSASSKPDIPPPSINYQYAFQPMFIPAGAMPIPMFPNAPIPVTSESEGEVKGVTSAVVMSSIQSETQATSSLPVSINTSPTHVIKCDDTNTVSTMSTTSISNTGSGAIYQEMILSSKSLVDVKKRRRQTAIQMLKSKSGDQNFLCTSFRIRPRLVAQAQAQRERLAAKGVKEEDDEVEYTDSKNLISPQNDIDHFGENKSECGVDFADIQVKQEVDADDELYENMNAYEAKEGIVQKNDRRKKTTRPLKRYMLKGSQKRKAKFYGSRIVNENGDMAAGNDRRACAKQQGANNDSSDLFQELFNCKVCNKIISVDDMEAHSLEHSCKNYQCPKCDSAYNSGQVGAEEDPPKCLNCSESLIKLDEREYNDGNIECDECPETFKSLPEFYEHKTGHKNDQTSQGGFECDFCGKIYQYYHALQFHRRTHRERKVPCLDKSCESKFRSRKEMEVHFDLNHPEKKEYFHCVYEGCTKKFLKNFHLQEHIRVKHYNIKAFQCPWPGCMKEFAARGHLKIHLLIHRDEKPMKCDHCEYRCRQRSAMNWHMRKHPDVPYKYKRAVKSPSASKSESE